jgi:hypothetical protein
MNDPQTLRSKATRARELARKPRRNRAIAPHQYLMSLAASFEEEATRIERVMAGDKPNPPEPMHIDLGPLVGHPRERPTRL